VSVARRTSLSAKCNPCKCAGEAARYSSVLQQTAEERSFFGEWVESSQVEPPGSLRTLCEPGQHNVQVVLGLVAGRVALG
jgi:hypothetical protein